MYGTAEHLAAVAEIAAKLRTLRDEAAKIEATADSPDGLIRATVTVHGDLLELDLDDRIYRTSDSVALANAITETIKSAAGLAVEAVLARSAELFGEDG